MKGRRIPSPFDASGALVGEWPQPGDYYYMPEQGWCACTPDGRLANLSGHTVTVYGDGTISVLPSILVSGGGLPTPWHGYLECGIWREC